MCMGWAKVQVHDENKLGCSSNYQHRNKTNKSKNQDNRKILFNQYINNHEQNIGRNMDVRGHLGNASYKSESRLLDTTGSTILVVKPK